MKNGVFKAKKIIQSNKGESLMESIVSLVILSILIVTVSAMLVTSLKMTGASMQRAKEMQEETANALALLEYSEDGVSIAFSNTDNGIFATHEISLEENDGLIAFVPPDGVGP